MSTTTAHNPIGNIDLTVSITNHQELEYNYIHNRVREIQKLSSSSSKLSPQESTSIEERLYSLQIGTDINEINRPQVGSYPLNDYTTENLMEMCFPKCFLDVKG